VYDAAVSRGQLYSWREIETYPADWMHEANLGTAWSLRGLSLDDVLSALRVLVERNEALRTMYHRYDGVPVQRVLPATLAQIEHVDRELTDRGDADRTKDALLALPFPMTGAVGWRGSLVTTAGVPRFLALSFSHLIVDVWSVRHLQRQFRDLVAGGDCGDVGPSPAELARRQRDGSTGPDAADRYWRKILAGDPMRQLPTLAAGQQRNRIQATLHSRRLGAVAALAAGRLGVTQPAIVMALVAAGLARHLGTERVTLSQMSSNRFAPDLVPAVGTLNQLIPVTIDVDQASSLAEHVKRVHWAVARAYRYSCYDFDRVAELAGQLGDAPGHGCWFNHLLRCWFNYLQFDQDVPDADDATPAQLVWTPLARQYGQPFDVRVTVEGGRTSVALRVDPEVIPADAVTDMLHTVALGTELAATDPNISVKDLWSARVQPLPAALFPLRD